MTVKEVAQKLNLTPVCEGECDSKEVTGCHIGDLLSLVMSKAQAGDAWITVQTHLNVLAVAELNEAACIIIPEGISVDAATVEKAIEKEISVLVSSMTAYELCWKMHELLA